LGSRELKESCAHDVIDGVEAGGFYAQQHLALAHCGQVEGADL